MKMQTYLPAVIVAKGYVVYAMHFEKVPVSSRYGETLQTWPTSSPPPLPPPKLPSTRLPKSGDDVQQHFTHRAGYDTNCRTISGVFAGRFVLCTNAFAAMRVLSKNRRAVKRSTHKTNDIVHWVQMLFWPMAKCVSCVGVHACVSCVSCGWCVIATRVLRSDAHKNVYRKTRRDMQRRADEEIPNSSYLPENPQMHCASIRLRSRLSH